MKKEIIICVIVLILVVIGNIMTQNHTKECVKNLDEQLTNLQQEIDKQAQDKVKQEQLVQKSEEIKQSWDDMQETLSFYIEHDELEKVETQLSLLAGEMKAELYQDAVPEIEKCQFILEHIADKNALNIKNIF